MVTIRIMINTKALVVNEFTHSTNCQVKTKSYLAPSAVASDVTDLFKVIVFTMITTSGSWNGLGSSLSHT